MIRTMLKRLIRTAISSPLILAVIVVTVPLSGCGLRQPPAASRSSAAIAPRVPSGSDKFADATSDLEAALEAASRGFAKGSIDTTALAGIRSFSGKLTKLDRGVRADFAKARKILKKIDSPEKDAIQKRVERQYEQRSETLRSKLYDIEQARGSQESSVAVAALAEWLEEINPDSPMRPLGTELPHRIVDRKAGPPVLGTAIAPAYAPNTPGAIPSTLPVEPTPEDLAETLEVQFSPEIRSLATSLGNDPVRMYEWVRNNIDFEPYYGSKKTAADVLDQLSGNDVDTSSLLIAMYRCAGVPARYVSGVVELPIEGAINWTGVGRPMSVVRLFSSSGIPSAMITAGGEAAAVMIEHRWVEVHVPYSDYRGTRGRDGEWIPLDASFKQYKPQAASPAGLVPSTLPATGTEETSTATLVDLDSFNSSVRSTAASLVASNDETRGVEWLMNRREIERRRAGVLPSSLPFVVVCVSGESRQIADDEQAKLRIQLPGAQPVRIPLSAVSSSRITIGFVGETAADRILLASSNSAGEVSVGLMKVAPQLRVDGRVVSVGEALGLGEHLRVEMYLEAGGHSEECSVDVSSGGFYSLVVRGGETTASNLEECFLAYDATAESMVASDAVSPEGAEVLLGELFNATGALYRSQVDSAYRLLASTWQVVNVQKASAVVVGTSVSTSYVLGLPIRLRQTGVTIDVRADSHVVQSRLNATEREAGYLVAAGAMASFLEGRTIEIVFGLEGISTVRILQIANNSGIPIHLIDSSNEQEIAGLACDESVKTEVRELARSGRRVLIPERGIDYHGYHGTGYIAVDPDTGESAFMIAGGLAGGSSTSNAGETESGSGDEFNWGATPAYASSLNSPKSPTSSPNPDPNPQWDLLFALFINGLTLAFAAWSSTAMNNIAAAISTIGSLVALSKAIFAYLETSRTRELEDELFMLGYAFTVASQVLVVGCLLGSKTVAKLAYGAAALSVIVSVGVAMGLVTVPWVTELMRDKERQIEEMSE